MRINTDKTCKTCGKPFHPIRHMVFCSEECRVAYQAAKSVGAKVVFTEATCPTCGKEFTTRRRWQRYCSNRCRSGAYQNKLQGVIEDSSPYKLRFSILARDGFRCRYCGRSAQEDGVKLVVDHIIARSQGGTDEPTNLITACQDCNTGKGGLLLLTTKGQIPSYLTIESISVFPSTKQ